MINLANSFVRFFIPSRSMTALLQIRQICRFILNLQSEI